MSSPSSSIHSLSSLSTSFFHTASTAGLQVPPDVSEVSLVFAVGHEEFCLGHTYLHTLPRKDDGLFLFFDEEVSPNSLILRFQVSQVCYVCLDQSAAVLAPAVPSQRHSGNEDIPYRVSNQVILYVQPKDFQTSLYCNQAVETEREGERPGPRELAAVGGAVSA